MLEPDITRKPMDPLRDLASRWRSDAETLRRYADERGASICEAHARALDEAAVELDAEILTLGEASAQSGYSERRLRELIASGSIPNAGRKHAPRIRRRDLPRKPRGKHPAGQYDAAVDARSLLSKLRPAS